MIMKFLYFILIFIFKIFTELYYVSEELFDYNLPKHYVYDYIIGKVSLKIYCTFFLFSVIKRFFDLQIINDVLNFIFSVGSGSSGSLISSNLKGKVLLIEAGGFGNSFSFNIPILQPLLIRSSYDWKYNTVSQIDSCKALNNNQSFWPAGKILSGTSRLNNMIYHTGHYTDYIDIVDRIHAKELFEKVKESIPIKETNFKSKISHDLIKAAKDLGFDGKF